MSRACANTSLARRRQIDRTAGAISYRALERASDPTANDVGSLDSRRRRLGRGAYGMQRERASEDAVICRAERCWALVPPIGQGH